MNNYIAGLEQKSIKRFFDREDLLGYTGINAEGVCITVDYTDLDNWKIFDVTIARPDRNLESNNTYKSIETHTGNKTKMIEVLKPYLPLFF